MKEFNQYEIANISDHDNSKIKELEAQIKDQTGQEVVLIAYQENQKEKLS